MNVFKVLGLGMGWLAVHLCASADTVTFSYTGSVQSFVVPPSVTSITIKAWGAQGGTNNAAFTGNQGGYATGALTVTPGETLEIYVGGQPVGVAGGFNGGGLESRMVPAVVVRLMYVKEVPALKTEHWLRRAAAAEDSGPV